MSEQALKDIRVLDFGTYLAGAATTMYLSRLGAEIIKIEHPTRPDGGRYFVTAPGVLPPDPRQGSQLFCTGNVNKKDVSIDISQPEGKELLRGLIKESDVFYENMVPGTMAKHGFSYEEVRAINPKIIYVSSSSCGQEGPEKNFVGYAAHFANKSGLGHLTGYEGSRPSIFVGGIDVRSASMGLVAILSAIFYKQRTGKGQYIDIASQEAISAQLGDSYLDYIINGNEQGRQANKRPGFAPQDAYPTKNDNEYIAISIETQEQWESLCSAIGKPEIINDSRFATYASRCANATELDEIIVNWTKSKERYEAVEFLQNKNIPAGPCLNSQGVYEDPHHQARGTFIPVEHRDLGTDYALVAPWRFEKTPSEIIRPAPLLGEHTTQVLKNILKKTDQELNALAEKKVIRRIYDYECPF